MVFKAIFTHLLIDFCSGSRKSKQIVEIMVDTGNDFDIMTRYDVLNNDNLVEKFKCGNAPIKRSL